MLQSEMQMGGGLWQEDLNYLRRMQPSRQHILALVIESLGLVCLLNTELSSLQTASQTRLIPDLLT